MAKKTVKVMSLVDHLEELRQRLIICGIAVFLAAVFSYLQIDRLRAAFARPAGDLVCLTLTEALMTNMRLAFATGFFLSLPVIFYQAWCFVLPGLYKRERRAVLLVSFLSLFFFSLGVLFCFFIILPLSVRFFLTFASDGLVPVLSFQSYISYSIGLLFGFGLVFEMPVVVMVLARLGLITAEFLAGRRIYATVGIFMLAAILTPPDVFSQVLLGLPMLLLYELSVFLARLAGGREGKMLLDQAKPQGR